jgi:hypothetical protein
MSLVDPVSVPQWAERYPRAPGRLSHSLAADPLLSPPALAVAARMLPPALVERRGAALDADQHPADVIATGGPESGEIVLRSLAQLPAYRKLIDRLLAELSPPITRATGPLQAPEAAVMLSAPGAPTPFHFDARFAILFQIAGDKVLAAYPSAPPFLDLARREACEAGGEIMLDWQPEYAAAGEQHLLAPGDALFVPYAAPHWARAGKAASISLVLSWQSRESLRVADAVALNPLLRRIGLPAFDPVAVPVASALRAAAGRFGRGLGLI